MAEAMQLQQDMVDFCAATREQVAALIARTPLDLRPRRAKVILVLLNQSINHKFM